jgi:chemotaxis protein CheC
MKALSHREREVLTETMSIGVDRAAVSLSQLLDEEVLLEVAVPELIPNEALGALIRESGGGRVAGVVQSFSGPVGGKALLLFADTDAARLIRLLLRDDTQLTQFTEMEREALAEVGNIVLNACLAALSDLLKEEIETRIPRYCDSLIDELFEADEDGFQGWVVLRMRVSVAARDVASYMSFVLTGEAMDVLGDRIQQRLLTEGL